MAITYKVPNEPFVAEGSPVKRPEPKPRSKKSLRNLEGTADCFDRYSKDGVQLRDRSSSYSGEQQPQPKPRMSKSVRYVDRPTASADSSPQTDRFTKRPSLQPIPLVHALLSKQLTINDKTTASKQMQSPESSSKIKGPFSLDKRQRASSEPKKVTRTPPERPPPYIPKKKKQHSLSISHSKTPPARHPGFSPHHSPLPRHPGFSPHHSPLPRHPGFSLPSPPLVQSTTPTPLRGNSSIVSNPLSICAAKGTEVSRRQKPPPRKIFDGHHNYEELDKPVNLSSSSEDEGVVDRKSSTAGVPDLPPRSIPRVVGKKHRLLASTAFEQSDGEHSPKKHVAIQDTGECEAFDDQSEKSDNVSEDSYVSMDGGIKKEMCFEEDQEDDIYIEMNPAEYTQPPRAGASTRS